MLLPQNPIPGSTVLIMQASTGERQMSARKLLKRSPCSQQNYYTMYAYKATLTFSFRKQYPQSTWPSTQEAEAGGLQVQDCSDLHRKTLFYQKQQQQKVTFSGISPHPCDQRYRDISSFLTDMCLFFFCF